MTTAVPRSSIDGSPASPAGDPARSAAFRARLCRYVSRRTPAADVDDVVQDVFLHYHAAAPRSPVRNVESYLYAIARHLQVSRSRRARRTAPALPLEQAPEPATGLSPERILLGCEQYALAVAALNRLPPRARTALRLRCFDEMSYRDIADRMNISTESVKELLVRARACVLKVKLAEY